LATFAECGRLPSNFADRDAFHTLHRLGLVLYVQQHEKACQCKNTRQCLDKLAGDAPERKAALIRSLLPGIEAAVNSGQSLKKIWEALASEGLQMSYHSFQQGSMARPKEETTAASNWGNRISLLRRKDCRKQKWKQLKGGIRLRI